MSRLPPAIATASSRSPLPPLPLPLPQPQKLPSFQSQRMRQPQRAPPPSLHRRSSSPRRRPPLHPPWPGTPRSLAASRRSSSCSATAGDRRPATTACSTSRTSCTISQRLYLRPGLCSRSSRPRGYRVESMTQSRSLPALLQASLALVQGSRLHCPIPGFIAAVFTQGLFFFQDLITKCLERLTRI